MSLIRNSLSRKSRYKPLGLGRMRTFKLSAATTLSSNFHDHMARRQSYYPPPLLKS